MLLPYTNREAEVQESEVIYLEGIQARQNTGFFCLYDIFVVTK